MRDRLGEHLADLLEEPVDPAPGERRAAALRIDTGKEHCFGRVDVPEPEDPRLIKQNELYGTPRGFENRTQVPRREFLGEGLGGEFRDLLCPEQFRRFHDPHITEMALILEDEASFVIEVKGRVGEFRIVPVGAEKHEPA